MGNPVKLFEAGNLLFVNAQGGFLVLDIANPTLPAAIKSYEGSFLEITKDILVVRGSRSLLFYKINFTNEGPVIENQSFNINESEPNGTLAGQVVASDLDDNSLAFSIISGNDVGTFKIDAETGEITVADESTLDFETNPIYTLAIEVSDGFESASAQVTINVLEINLPPEISNQTFSINENYRDSNVGEVEASDPENETIIFSITLGNNAGVFEINENNGIISLANEAVLNFDTDPFYVLTVEMSDGIMVSDAQVTININENQAPQYSPEDFTTSENIFGTTSLGTVEVSDQEDDPLSFTLAEAPGSDIFEIDIETGELFVLDIGALSFANSPTIEIEVYIFDGLDTTIANVTVNITENQDPQISNQSFTISENSSAGFLVGEVSASDSEEDPLTFEIKQANNSGIFDVDNETGELFVLDNSALDFANSPTLEIGIIVFDGLDVSSATITLNITENQTPQINDQSFTISENTSNGAAVGTVAATDSNNDALTFSINSGNDLEAFTIDSQSGEFNVSDSSKLQFKTNPLFELGVQVFDGQKTASATVTISLTENFAPTIADASKEVNEDITGGTLIISMVASDPNNDDLIYSIKVGNENDIFDLNPSTGQLTLSDLGVLDFETTASHELTIGVTDGKLTDDSLVSIDVVDVDESPIVDNESFSIDENSQNGTIVGQLNASDPEGSTLVFTIDSGNQDGIFALDEGSGQLSVVDSTKLDFEINPSIILTTSVSDGTLATVSTVSIEVKDINEKPSVTAQVLAITENPENGAELGVIESSDPDGDILVYSIISGDDSGSFSITTNTGLLNISDSTLLDFEVNEVVNLTIQVTDGGLSANTVVVVNLTDINEMPQITDQEFVLIGESPNGTVIGSIEAVDPENDDLSYSIKSGNDNDTFGLDENTGELTVLNINLLDFENTQSVLLEIETSDAEFTSAATITINLEEKVVAGVTIEDNEIIRIYPNPANTYTFVDLETISNKPYDLEIYTLNGKIICSQKFRGGKLNVSSLNSGIYFLILKDKKDLKGKFKLIVEH